MTNNTTESPQRLRIEIWTGDNMEWSLDGDGSPTQFQQAAIKLRPLFPEENELLLVEDSQNVRAVGLSSAIEEVRSLPGNKNIMICDRRYERMMMFIYKE